MFYTCLNIRVFDLSALKTISYLQDNSLHILNIYRKPALEEHNKTTSFA